MLTRDWIARGQEVGLGDVAAGGVTAAGDHEESVHPAVGRSIEAPLKPRFADRTILGNEPGDRVLCPIQGRNCDLRILQRTCAASTRLCVARQTLVRVEAGTEAIVRAVSHDFDFGKPALPILKKRCFVRRKTVQRTPGACRATAHAGVYRTRPGLSQVEAASGQRHSNDCAETLDWNSPDNSHDEPPECPL
jgi:hypothetical protein